MGGLYLSQYTCTYPPPKQSYIDLALSLPAKSLGDDQGDRTDAAAAAAVLKSILHSCKVKICLLFECVILYVQTLAQ